MELVVNIFLRNQDSQNKIFASGTGNSYILQPKIIEINSQYSGDHITVELKAPENRKINI